MTKTTKTFFNCNNRLNKGYDAEGVSIECDVNLLRKKFEQHLPPVDVISAYEEIYPGILEKLIELTTKEQQHRHLMEMKNLEMYKKAKIIGKFFGLLVVFCICYVVLELVKEKQNNTAIIFSFISFGSIFFVSLFYYIRTIFINKDKKIHKSR